MDDYVKGWHNYINFKGRASRSEFWIFTIINFLIILAFVFLMAQFQLKLLNGVVGLFALASLIPSLSITVRRLHDAGLSGWLVLIYFFPFLGALVLFGFMLAPGDKNKNRFGPNPRHERETNEGVLDDDL